MQRSHRHYATLERPRDVAQHHRLDVYTALGSGQNHDGKAFRHLANTHFRAHLLAQLFRWSAIAVWCVLATSGDLVAHRIIHSTGHLANAELWATHCEAEVIDGMLIHPHDVLQAQAPPHEETEGANVQCQPGTAAPAPQGLPEGTDSTDCVGVGDAHHWATESLEANPTVVEATKYAVVEVRHARLGTIPHHLI